MRNAVVALAFALALAIPIASRADTTALPHRSVGPVAGLLQRLNLHLIAPAKAAECTEEGEACAANEDCCPGLVCGGGPPATCGAED